MNIQKIIKKLSETRPVFCSEADFQLALAWQIKEIYKEEVEVRLEYCFPERPDWHIDIVVIQGNKRYPIELKYKTKKAEIEYKKEKFILKNQAAQNLGKYDFWNDVYRIETLKNDERLNIEKGYVIMITNDLSYLDKSGKNAMSYNFGIYKDRVVNKETLIWQGEPSKAITNNRKILDIKGDYKCHWVRYSKKIEEEFNYLLLEV